jgi:Protein of unknown function (DUF3575)
MTMRKYSAILTIALIFCQCTSAQQAGKDFPVWSLRTNPVSFFSPDGGIMIGANYRWSKKFSVSFDPTYVFYSLVLMEDDGKKINPKGINLQGDFRMHLPRNYRMRETFFASRVHYRNIKADRFATFGIGCENGNCDYYQYDKYEEKQMEIGLSINAGTIRRLSQNGRWFIELSFGLGYKYVKFSESGVPVGATFITLPQPIITGLQPLVIDSDSFYYPMAPGAIRVIFVL